MTNKDDNPLNLETLPKAVKEHIAQLELMRTDFVANVSHELRTPLTVVHGYLETLIKKQDPALNTYKTIFEQMYQHSIRMENIIDDLLLLSRLESENQPVEEHTHIAIYNMLQALCEAAEHISGNKQHHISLDADKQLQLSGAPDELRSVFSNLIINAVKYTPAQGHIQIQWHHDNHHAIFSVTDTGIGIDPAHIPRLTERFYRVDKARSRGSGGTGLGLAIVKHVLMRHQAELNITSTPGKGSSFSCQFPKQRTIQKIK